MRMVREGAHVLDCRRTVTHGESEAVLKDLENL
jgi:hypothetical protein